MSKQKQEATQDTEGEATAGKQQKKSDGSMEGGSQANSSGMGQIGDLAGKIVDLAGVSISLGFNLLDKSIGMAQDVISEKMSGGARNAEQSYETPSDMHADQPYPERHPEEGSPDDSDTDQEVLWVINRLPAYAGSPLKVSFSLNNDSLESPRKIVLKVGTFTGEKTGHAINEGVLSVKPKSKTIAPMDFDKFMLTGDLPEDTPPDMYYGWIVISAENEVRIPVRIGVLDTVEK